MQAVAETQVNKVTFISVTDMSGAGQRIDNYLFNKLKGVPKSKIYSILRRGEVRVNKGRIKPSYKLQVDDLIRVPPITVAATDHQVAPSSAQVAHFNLDQAILFEDQHLLILNKPAGLAVHGGSGLSFGLIELLRAQRKTVPFLELVHRLDRDTSGCIMIAKSPIMLRGLHALLRDGGIKKHYHTLVKGYVAGDFIVNLPLKKFNLQSGERMVRVNAEDGQPSITNFVLLERFRGMSLLQAEPITGRTHQIRVHAAHRGLPVIGDDKYGNKEFNQVQRKLGFKRMFLHARQLQFVCPVTGQDVSVQAAYDQVWTSSLNSLVDT